MPNRPGDYRDENTDFIWKALQKAIKTIKIQQDLINKILNGKKKSIKKGEIK